MARLAVAAALLTLLASGCAPGGERPYAELEPPRQAVDGVTGRRCHYLAEPRVPSSLDVLTRPGTRGALLLWGREAAPGDTVELSIRYGSDGRLAWARAIRSTMSLDRVAELERLIGAGLDEGGPGDWGLRVRVVGGEVDAMLPAVVCQPEQGNRVGTVVGQVATNRELVEAHQVRVRRIQVMVALDEDGRIRDARLVQSTGSRLLDQYAVDLARAYRYLPKLHDGIGVASVMPVVVQLSRR